MSEDFCLPFGAWTVKMNVEPNGTLRQRAYYFSDRTCAERGACRGSEAITYEPVLDYAWCHFGRDLANPATYPFAIFWGIFSSGWREEAEMASKGSEFGLNFLNELPGGGRKPGPGRGGGAWSTSGRK